MMDIGDLRRRWFVDGTSDWNSKVREVSARLETSGGFVDHEAFQLEMLLELRREVKSGS